MPISEDGYRRMVEAARRGGKASAAKRGALGQIRKATTDTLVPKRCENCWLEVATWDGLHHMSRGRCNACARFWERTGRERPPATYLRYRGTVAPQER